jgi:hypothetical protein
MISVKNQFNKRTCNVTPFASIPFSRREFRTDSREGPLTSVAYTGLVERIIGVTLCGSAIIK